MDARNVEPGIGGDVLEAERLDHVDHEVGAGPYATLSKTLIESKSAEFWKSIPTRRRILRERALVAEGDVRAVEAHGSGPSAGCTPMSALSSTLFPQPDLYR